MTNQLLSTLIRLFLCSLVAVTTYSEASPVKLNATLVGGGNVDDLFRLSEDSKTVLYLADQEVDGVHELYSVPITGGTPIKLNPALVDVGIYKLTSDSTTVVYTAKKITEDVFEFFSVPTTGGEPVRLTTRFFDSFGVHTFQLTSNDNTVLYVADQNNVGARELFSVSISGGPPIKLSGPLVSGGNVDFSLFEFQVTTDNKMVVYVADQEIDGLNELYTVPIIGGAPIKLNAESLINGFGSLETRFEISPDGKMVVYTLDQDPSDGNELYSVPIAGGIPVKLNSRSTSSRFGFSNFQISADSKIVVYRYFTGTIDNSGSSELLSVPITGGAPVKIHSSTQDGGQVLSFQVSPNASHVVYRTDQDTDDVFELYAVPIMGGGTPIKLNGNLGNGESIAFDFAISKNSKTVVYRTDGDNVELFSVPIAGGTPVKLNTPFSGGGNITFEFRLGMDGRTVIYRADQNSKNVAELFAVSITGGTPIRLNGPFIPGGQVLFNSFQLSSDANFVVYIADQDTDGTNELYSVLIDFDSDELPDNWEIQHFGDTNQIGTDDFDGDGLSNIQEFQKRLNPTLYSIDLQKGWNLVSIASVLIDNSITAIFGNAIMGKVWYWNNGKYRVATELEPNKGYWVFVSQRTTKDIQLPL